MTSTQSINSQPVPPIAVPAGRAVSLAVGRRIVNDDVIGRPQTDDPFLAGETAYAHTKIACFRDGFLEHVWTRDGGDRGADDDVNPRYDVLEALLDLVHDRLLLAAVRRR